MVSVTKTASIPCYLTLAYTQRCLRGAIQDTYSLGSTLAVFDAPDILADQRVLKVTLGYVLTLLRGLAQWISAQEMEDIVSKVN